MYTPLNLLPDSVAVNNRRNSYRHRWETPAGQKLAETVIGKLTAPGGTAFLDANHTKKAVPFLEDANELRGLTLVGQSLVFPEGHNFSGMNLNYWLVRDTIFRHAAFQGGTSNFSNFTGAVFDACTFIGVRMYGTEFEDCEFDSCNFLERNAFTNCSFKNVTFNNCFFETDTFVDCVFDELTTVNEPVRHSRPVSVSNFETVEFNPGYLSAIYRGIKEAYEAGRISHLQRHYVFAEKHALTRHNTAPGAYRVGRRFLETTTGYGIKPVRVLATALLIFIVSAAVFSTRFGDAGFLLSAGGFFTFGANTDLLRTAGVGYQILYVVFAFLGVTSTSTFIVVLTNYWASLR